MGLTNDPLFVGLTRPALFLGVSNKFGMLNFMLVMVLFINTKSIMSVVIGALVHGFGMLLCKKDALMIELEANRLQFRCPNKFFHGAHSYEEY